MTNEKKIQSLWKLLDKARELKMENSSDPDFKVWKNLVERTLMKVFGDNSFEVLGFRKLIFFYNPRMYMLGDDFATDHLRCFRRDFEIAEKNILAYIEEFQEEPNEAENEIIGFANIKKVFISHSSLDKMIVEEIIDLLETIGLNTNQLFCSSFEGYGIDLGENFLDRIKEELDEEVLVLFILSTNFYNSPVCLCEMGATRIKTNEHIPIFVPPLEYENVKGVIPLTQGFIVNENLKFNLFKKKIEDLFNLSPIDNSSWERKRDKALKRINSALKDNS